MPIGWLRGSPTCWRRLSTDPLSPFEKQTPPNTGGSVRGDADPDLVNETEVRSERVVGVQEWAEIRAMKAVEGLSIKEIARRGGHSRNTIGAALRSPGPPSCGPRPTRPSKLDPHKPRSTSC